MKRKTPLILLLILALVSTAWVLLRPKPVPPPVVLHPTPQRLAQAETHLNGLGQTVSAPGSKPRTLRLSEDDLNIYLAGSQSVRKLLGAHGVTAIQISLQEPNSVVVHAAVHVRSHSQNIEIDGTLAPDPKMGLRFTASHAQVGSLPLPAPFVTAQASKLAAHFAGRFFRRLSVSVQSVAVQKKELVIVGLPVKRPGQAASLRSRSPARH